jgi:hypothetical protein
MFIFSFLAYQWACSKKIYQKNSVLSGSQALFSKPTLQKLIIKV